MPSASRFNDRDIIERYTDQPSGLPESLRRAVTQPSSDAIVSYALADLDQQLALGRTWLVLSTSDFAQLDKFKDFAKCLGGGALQIALFSTIDQLHVLRRWGWTSITLRVRPKHARGIADRGCRTPIAS